ncbi:MAG: DUF3471 domain-containing protein [Pyrinomonadaceae bacterium]|nr:DUF3471 domain-containing protein [Pyrinomonadaceae bacterium]
MKKKLFLMFAIVSLAGGVLVAQDKTEEQKTANKKSFVDALFETAKEKGGAAAVAEYRRLRGDKKVDYDFSEGELKRLGTRLLRAELASDAIEIFKLNAEIFPKSSKAYDSLGEAYLSDGQLGMGLVTYRKALELDPDNKNAAETVRRLEAAGIKEDSVLPKPAKDSADDKIASAKAVERLKKEGKLYDSYVGKYEFMNSHMVVSREGDKLFLQFGPAAKREITPVSDTEFSISPIDSITFSVDSEGKVTGATLKHHVHKIFAKKIE